MADLYSFVDAVDGLENKIKLLEDIIIRISVQTTECGIFIKQYVSHGFAGRLLDRSSVVLLRSVLNNHYPGRLTHQTISPTSQTISDLSEALRKLKEDFHLGVTSHVAFVSAQTSRDVKRLGTKIQRRMCVPDANLWSLQLKLRH